MKHTAAVALLAASMLSPAFAARASADPTHFGSTSAQSSASASATVRVHTRTATTQVSAEAHASSSASSGSHSQHHEDHDSWQGSGGYADADSYADADGYADDGYADDGYADYGGDGYADGYGETDRSTRRRGDHRRDDDYRRDQRRERKHAKHKRKRQRRHKRRARHARRHHHDSERCDRGCDASRHRHHGHRAADCDRHEHARQRWEMSDEQFAEFLVSLRAESFASGRMRLLQVAARDNYFTAAQVQTVVAELTFSSNKVDAAVLMYPRVVDQDDFYTVLGAFTFESSKRAVRQRLSL